MKRNLVKQQRQNQCSQFASTVYEHASKWIKNQRIKHSDDEISKCRYWRQCAWSLRKVGKYYWKGMKNFPDNVRIAKIYNLTLSQWDYMMNEIDYQKNDILWNIVGHLIKEFRMEQDYPPAKKQKISFSLNHDDITETIPITYLSTINDVLGATDNDQEDSVDDDDNGATPITYTYLSTINDVLGATHDDQENSDDDDDDDHYDDGGTSITYRCLSLVNNHDGGIKDDENLENNNNEFNHDVKGAVSAEIIHDHDHDRDQEARFMISTENSVNGATDYIALNPIDAQEREDDELCHEYIIDFNDDNNSFDVDSTSLMVPRRMQNDIDHNSNVNNKNNNDNNHFFGVNSTPIVQKIKHQHIDDDDNDDNDDNDDEDDDDDDVATRITYTYLSTLNDYENVENNNNQFNGDGGGGGGGPKEKSHDIGNDGFNETEEEEDDEQDIDLNDGNNDVVDSSFGVNIISSTVNRKQQAKRDQDDNDDDDDDDDDEDEDIGDDQERGNEMLQKHSIIYCLNNDGSTQNRNKFDIDINIDVNTYDNNNDNNDGSEEADININIDNNNNNNGKEEADIDSNIDDNHYSVAQNCLLYKQKAPTVPAPLIESLPAHLNLLITTFIKCWLILTFELLDELITSLHVLYQSRNNETFDSSLVYATLFYLIPALKLIPQKRLVCNTLTQGISLQDILQLWIDSSTTFLTTTEEKENWKKLIIALKFQLSRYQQQSERFGPTKPWANKKCHKNSCYVCWKHFDTTATGAGLRCAGCANINYRCHTKCISVVGINDQFGICPNCCHSKQWQQTVPIKEIKDLTQLRICAKINKGNECDLFEYIPNETRERIYIGMQLIPQRFIKIRTDLAQQYIPQYDELKRNFKSRPTNVTYTVHEADLIEGINEYLHVFGDSTNNKQSFNWLPSLSSSKIKIQMGQVGPLKFNGFAASQEILKILNDYKNSRKNIINGLKSMFPDDTPPHKTDIYTSRCSATSISNHTSILSLGLSYKGLVGCRDLLLFSEETQNKAFEEDLEGLQSLFSKKELLNVKKKKFKKKQKKKRKKLIKDRKARKTREKKQKKKDAKLISDKRKNKFKVIPSTALSYVTKHHPEVIEAINEFKILIEALNYTVAKYIPQVYYPFMQYMLKDEHLKRIEGTQCGAWNGNVDLIKYSAGSKVVQHEDNHGLIRPDCVNFGTYTVFKLNLEGLIKILCNVSKTGTNCSFDRCSEPGDQDYGGHLSLLPGSVYWMFEIGAVGGITHALHNNETGGEDAFYKSRFGPFLDESHTLVFRPFF